MINFATALRAYLVAQPSLAALVGSRVWAEEEMPPPGYKPSDGAAIAFRTRGGGVQGQQHSFLLRPSIQFKVYGATKAAALQAWRALFDAMDHPASATIRAAELETMGQPLYEPDTGWPFVLAFYIVTFANEEE